VISIFVKYSVKEEFCDEFLSEVVKHSQRCIKNETGCLLFHVCKSSENSNDFLLYEEYKDKVSVEQHRASKHYKNYSEYVKHWVLEKKVELAERIN